MIRKVFKRLINWAIADVCCEMALSKQVTDS